MARRIVLGFALLVMALSQLGAAGAQGQPKRVFDAADPAIQYAGRVARGETTLWSWPGTGFRVFYANSPAVALRLEAENYPEQASNNVDRWVKYRIDRGPWRSFRVPPELDGLFPLATPGDTGEHLLEVYKASEGRLTFGGIVLDIDGTLRPPAERARRIEVIGDSISAGASVWNTDSAIEFTDNDALSTYGWLLGEALDAEVRLIAVSGWGIIHSYERTPEESITLPQIYPYLHRELGPLNDWSWQPDLILINLGGNDLTEPVVSDEAFGAAYTQFLADVRQFNPEARIVVVQPFGIFDGTMPVFPRATRDAVEARRAAGDERIYYVDAYGWLGKGDFSDIAHPNARGHRRVAEQILPFIREVTAWMPSD
jgi:lysophospholipase L1-like esterase